MTKRNDSPASIRAAAMADAADYIQGGCKIPPCGECRVCEDIAEDQAGILALAPAPSGHVVVRREDLRTELNRTEVGCPSMPHRNRLRAALDAQGGDEDGR